MMNNKPKKWAALVLGLLAPPLGFLYVVQPVLAAIYFAALLGLAAVAFVFLHLYPAIALGLMIALYVGCAVHAYRLARAYPAAKERPHYSRWYGLLAIYVATYVLIFLFRSFLFEPFRQASDSMVPTMPHSSYLVLQKWGYGHYGSYGLAPFRTKISAAMQRGDLMVFDYPDDESVQYIKRLVGLPGDKISYRDKQLSINGVAVARRKDGEFVLTREGASPEQLTRYVENLDGREYAVAVSESVNRTFPATLSFKFREKCVYEGSAVSCEVPPGHYYFLGDNRDNSRDSRYWGFVPAGNVVGKVLFISR